MPTTLKHLKTTANAKYKREKSHSLLAWNIELDSGILVVEVSAANEDYANGDTQGAELTFHSFSDAHRQLTNLLSKLAEMEYNIDPYFCEHCAAEGVETKLPYEITKTHDWDCPVCNCPNMGS